MKNPLAHFLMRVVNPLLRRFSRFLARRKEAKRNKEIARMYDRS